MGLLSSFQSSVPPLRSRFDHLSLCPIRTTRGFSLSRIIHLSMCYHPSGLSSRVVVAYNTCGRCGSKNSRMFWVELTCSPVPQGYPARLVNHMLFSLRNKAAELRITRCIGSPFSAWTEKVKGNDVEVLSVVCTIMGVFLPLHGGGWYRCDPDAIGLETVTSNFEEHD